MECLIRKDKDMSIKSSFNEIRNILLEAKPYGYKIGEGGSTEPVLILCREGGIIHIAYLVEFICSSIALSIESEILKSGDIKRLHLPWQMYENIYNSMDNIAITIDNNTLDIIRSIIECAVINYLEKILEEVISENNRREVY